MNIKGYFSIVFYLEIDKQNKIANQKIKKHLYIFVSYKQNDWLKKVAMIKFVANNNKLVFIYLFSFFASKSLYSYMSYNIINFFNANICNQIYKQKALNILKNKKPLGSLYKKLLHQYKKFS